MRYYEDDLDLMSDTVLDGLESETRVCSHSHRRALQVTERLLRGLEQAVLDVAPSATPVPTPGGFYSIQYGKGGLLTTVGKHVGRVSVA